jgi:hypothetical protein
MSPSDPNQPPYGHPGGFPPGGGGPAGGSPGYGYPPPPGGPGPAHPPHGGYGHPGYPPQGRSNTALIVSIVVAVLLLGGVAGAWILGWLPGSNSPAPVATAPEAPMPVGSAPVAAPQTTPVVAPNPNPGVQDARTWRGAYTCGQGMTGLEVTMRPVGQGQLQGTFSFFPVSSNPNVPSGCFNITAHADRATQTIRTRAGSWVRQPPGYSTVDLEGRIDSNGNWRGRVVGAAGACTTFDLLPAPAPQASCGVSAR